MKVGTTMMGSFLLLKRLQPQDKCMIPTQQHEGKKDTFTLPRFRASLFADLPSFLPWWPPVCSLVDSFLAQALGPRGSLRAFSLPRVHSSSSHISLSSQDHSPVLSPQKRAIKTTGSVSPW